MDALVGYVLLSGVLLSMALVAAGLIWEWADTGSLALHYRLGGMNLFELVVAEIRLAGHDAIRPRLLVNFGIVVLMLTPFVRVLASVAYFAAFLKNWKYTLFTAFVLAVLTYSLFLR
jgi:uncharacterized membrane protein